MKIKPSKLVLGGSLITALCAFVYNFPISSAVSAKQDKFPDKLIQQLHLPNNGKVWEIVRHHLKDGNRIPLDSFAVWNRANGSVVDLNWEFSALLVRVYST